MGKDTMSRDTYEAAVKEYVPEEGPATRKAEQKALYTGKLDPLVDPAGYGLIRRSLRRLEKQPNNFWLLTVGTPLPIEISVDTTLSMGDNVDRVLEGLPSIFELLQSILPQDCYDIQMLNETFADIRDRFVYCRAQYEMEASKLVKQLTLMVPERNGYDVPEDPQYALFSSAYLASRYINQIGLKGYRFIITDAPGRESLDIRQIKRIFGEDVFEIIRKNGFQINPDNLPTTKEVVEDVLRSMHIFVLQVNNNPDATEYWAEMCGDNRVIKLPNTRITPQVTAVIVGLTEGTLRLDQVEEFLEKNKVMQSDAKKIARSVSKIPIGAQTILPNYGKIPRAGALFRKKTDIWPIDPREAEKIKPSEMESREEKPKENIWL